MASQMKPAVFDQTTIDVTATGPIAPCTCSARRDQCRSSMAILRIYEEGKDEKDEEDEELKHKLPAGGGRREAEVPRHQAGAAFHGAAAALQRSDAGEEAGIGRRGAAFDLRVDSVDDSGTRVREEGGRQVHAHRTGHGGDRPAARELQRHLRGAVHRADGRGAGRDRGRQDRLARWPWASSTSASKRI